MIFNLKLNKLDSLVEVGIGRFLIKRVRVVNSLKFVENLLKIRLEFRLLIVLKSLFVFFKVVLKGGRGLLFRSNEEV